MGVLKWRDLLNTTCNKQLQDSIGILRTIRLVVLIISAFWEMSLMVVVSTFSEQIKVAKYSISGIKESIRDMIYQDWLKNQLK